MTSALLSDPWQPLARALRGLPDLVESLHGLPWPAAAALLALGAVALAAGARARRPLAVVGGALLGLAAGAAASGWASSRTGLPPTALAVLAAGAVAILGGLFPPAFICCAGALPGALLGLALSPKGESALGLAAGAAAGGVVALLLSRWVAAVAAAGLGAALAAAALFAFAGRSRVAESLAAHPLALAGLVGVLTVAGAAFQHARAWAPGGRRPGRAAPSGGEAPTAVEP
jgi:hypothetical protein